VEGARAIIGWSPWVPHLACIISPWEGLVGNPVLGPPLWALTTTQGISLIIAKPKFSCFKHIPGPEVAVRDFSPAIEAPITAAILAISSSICINFPPILGNLRAIFSAISEEGVMG